MGIKNEKVTIRLITKTFLKKPTLFKVGDYNYIGTPNAYDKLAYLTGAKPVLHRSDEWVKMIMPIPSGLTRIEVVGIEKHYRPVEGSGITSWLTNGDYSKNSSFVDDWRVDIETSELYYELASLITG